MFIRQVHVTLQEGLQAPEEARLRLEHRDCHIEPDRVLIYFKNETTLVLSMTRTGTHRDVF